MCVPCPRSYLSLGYGTLICAFYYYYYYYYHHRSLVIVIFDSQILPNSKTSHPAAQTGTDIGLQTD